MARAVVEDLDQFKSYLSQQPLCLWAAQKQRDIDAGKVPDHSRKGLHLGGSPPKPNDNADLAAALASMA